MNESIWRSIPKTLCVALLGVSSNVCDTCGHPMSHHEHFQTGTIEDVLCQVDGCTCGEKPVDPIG